MMQESLELSLTLLKGFFLNHQTPPEIKSAFHDIELFCQYTKRPPVTRGDAITIDTSRIDTIVKQEKRTDGRVGSVAKFKPKYVVQRRSKLDPAKHLLAIQGLHDERKSNGYIAEIYSVSDQTIVNFLRNHGTYIPIAATGRKPKKAPLQVVPTPSGILGEELVSVTLSTPSFNQFPKGSKKKTAVSEQPESKLQPIDLVDIHDLLLQGKDTNDIGEVYGCSGEEVAAFVALHSGVKITKIKNPGYGAAINNHTVQSTGRNGRSNPS